MIRLVMMCVVLCVVEGRCGEREIGGESQQRGGELLRGVSVWGECRSRQRARQPCRGDDVTANTTTSPPIILTTTSTTTKPTVKPLPDMDEVPDEDVSSFDKTAKQIINNDKKAVELCLMHDDVKVKEMYLSEGYRLKYYIPDLVADSIAASVRHRTLRVTAQRLLGPRGFTDLEVLPEIADAAQAQWGFDGGVLTIMMPYRVPFNKEIDKTCKMNIEEKDIALKEFTEEIDVRFSNSGPQIAVVFPQEDA